MELNAEGSSTYQDQSNLNSVTGQECSLFTSTNKKIMKKNIYFMLSKCYVGIENK